VTLVDKKKSLDPWRVLRTEQGPDLGVFQVRYNWVKNPRNAKELKVSVVESEDWVNVVAITPDRKTVMVHQYRFGVGKIIMEIPGGLIDAGESSKEAAIRELEEETGYTSTDWKYLGAVEPIPAIRNNLCHHWLAENARKTEEPTLDEGEDIAVSTLSLSEIRTAIRERQLRDSMSLSALSRVFDLWNNLDEYRFTDIED
jgi:8-oxo-dGTP pyrophosphatase MutT (NUDIX family)